MTIRNLSTANELVDSAIAAALQEKKPVLIQVHLSRLRTPLTHSYSLCSAVK